MTKILVIAPHPDDAELGVGATLAKKVAEGAQATIAVVSAGALTMVHSGESISFDQRMSEQVAAAGVLGITDVRFLNLGVVGNLHNQTGMEFVSGLDKIMSEGWTEVYIPLPSYNQDHTATWHGCMAATRPGKVDNASIFAYENPMQGHGEQVLGPLVGRWYERVTAAHLTTKIDAFEKHGSQVNGRRDTIAGSGGVSALARLRGLECGTEFAEMFYPVRIVK